MNKPLIIITGPTASGKSGVAIELAKKLNTEVISADSMQIYQEMDIGTAKVTQKESDGIKHHMLDLIKPNTEFSVYDYQIQTKKIIDELLAQNKIPIICGGTGLYINSIIFDMDFVETPADHKYRSQLEAYIEKHGVTALHDRLKQMDPIRAASTDALNPHRVIRACELYRQRGKQQNSKKSLKKNDDYKVFGYILNRPRPKLYERINKRVDTMIDLGLIDEAKDIYKKYPKKENSAFKAIGYQELFKHFDDEYGLDFAIDKIKQHSRNYAKRQITWFKRYKDFKWIDMEHKKLNEVIEEIITDLEDVEK